MIKDFEYFAPKKLAEALTLLEKYKDDGKIICGGQSFLILMKQGLVAPEHLIDIKGLTELAYIKTDAKGMKIGATTTHRTIEKSKEMKGAYAILAEMENRLASIQTRNWGTIGGNLSHGDPAGDPAPVLMALGAILKLASINGERTVGLDKFYHDYFETDLKPGEMLKEIEIPSPKARTGVAYQKFNIIQSDMATVGVAVGITLAADDTVEDCKIALGAVAPTARRATEAEAILKGNKITDALLAKAGEAASKHTEPISDIYASAEYRAEIVKIMVRRLAKEAAARAKKS
jgi:aerobic carbon-monoxide dehydrogenase medium subunit